MNTSTEHYQFSNKFNLGSTIVLTLLGIFVAIILGVVYAIISRFSPLILIDIGLLVGMCYLIIMLQSNLSQLAKIRNVKINILMTFLICLFAYYSNLVTFEVLLFDTNYLSNWISLFLSPIDTITILIDDIIPYREITITKGSSSKGSISGMLLAGVYLVEFLVFFYPILTVLFIEDAFCEDCQTWYKKYFFYSLSNEELEDNINNSRVGSYANALANVDFHKDTKDIVTTTGESVSLLNYEYCQCPKCQQKSVLTITKKMLKHTDKGPQVEGVSDGILVNQAYIDQQTDHLFSSQI
ncbi:hypothetical protein GYM75_07100 [Gilliamella sp. ESL0441]|uniref:hypothetical protein n=1 Tax=Gilliamella sp. ESL0441 TaxID=2704654 RepID=UPI001C69D812|nr:hypothetical protein [Gilliamella sp. ESL0441]QYN44615.1 hypothetical protein GYM75_07100 [Gilliamella sp. ESL0441]